MKNLIGLLVAAGALVVACNTASACPSTPPGALATIAPTPSPSPTPPATTSFSFPASSFGVSSSGLGSTPPLLIPSSTP